MAYILNSLMSVCFSNNNVSAKNSSDSIPI